MLGKKLIRIRGVDSMLIPLYYKSMIRLLAALLINSIAVYIASYILPGVHVREVMTVLVVAVVLGVVNTVIRPVLVMLTLPISVITLGLFTLVINGLMVL